MILLGRKLVDVCLISWEASQASSDGWAYSVGVAALQCWMYRC